MKKNKFSFAQVLVPALAVCAVGMVLMPDVAHATVAGVTSPVDGVYTTLVNWTKTGLGRIISLLIIVVGIAAGVIKQSLFAIVIGIGAGLSLVNADAVISAIFPTTLASSAMVPVWQAVANGAQAFVAAIIQAIA